MPSRDEMYRQALNIPAPNQRISITDAAAAFGGGQAGHAELAMTLAGTRDKKSRAYKSQYQNVRRWLIAETGRAGQRRTVSARSVPRVAEVMRRQAMARAADRLSRPFSYAKTGVIYGISDKKRQARFIREDVSQKDIDDAETGDFRELLREGRENEAFDALDETMWNAYSLPGAYDENLDGLWFDV